MKNITNNTEAIDTMNEGAPVAPSPTLDALVAALNSRAARIALAILAGLVTVAALAGAAASVYALQAQFMNTGATVAAFNAGLVALMPLALALGAAQATRTRTHAALTMWLSVWAVTILALSALYGVLSAAAIVADVQALTDVGRIMAPLPGALAAVTVASVVMTLRGDDDAGALGHLWALIAKAVFVGFSSFGLLNVAMQADGIKQQAYAVALALVVESAFVALLSRQNRAGGAQALLYVLAGVLSLNAAESASIAFGFQLPGWLAWLPEAGRVSVVLSGAAVVLAVVALSVKTGKTAQPVTVADWLAARVADVQAVRAALPAATPAPPRRAAVAMAAQPDAPVAELARGGQDEQHGAPVEVTRRASKSGRRRAAQGGQTRRG